MIPQLIRLKPVTNNTRKKRKEVFNHSFLSPTVFTTFQLQTENFQTVATLYFKTVKRFITQNKTMCPRYIYVGLIFFYKKCKSPPYFFTRSLETWCLTFHNVVVYNRIIISQFISKFDVVDPYLKIQIVCNIHFFIVVVSTLRLVPGVSSVADRPTPCGNGKEFQQEPSRMSYSPCLLRLAGPWKGP